MARDGLRWLDSDMHLAEPGDPWASSPRRRSCGTTARGCTTWS